MYLEILKDEPVKNTLYEFNLRSNMQVLRIRSKFWGKSMEFQPEGEVGAKYFIYKIFRTTNTFTFSYFSANTLLQRGWIWILAQTSTKLKISRGTAEISKFSVSNY